MVRACSALSLRIGEAVSGSTDVAVNRDQVVQFLCCTPDVMCACRFGCRSNCISSARVSNFQGFKDFC